MAYGYYTPATATHPRDAFCAQLRLARKRLPLVKGMTAHDRNVVCLFTAFKAMGINSREEGLEYIAYLKLCAHIHTPPPFHF